MFNKIYSTFKINALGSEFTCYYEKDLENEIHCACMDAEEVDAFFLEKYPDVEIVHTGIEKRFDPLYGECVQEYSMTEFQENPAKNSAWRELDSIFRVKVQEKFKVALQTNWKCDRFEPTYWIPKDYLDYNYNYPDHLNLLLSYQVIKLPMLVG